MILASPHIDDLLSFIGKITKYPISAGEVADIAKNSETDDEISKFYRSFPKNEVFSDEDDLLARTELITTMGQDDQPKEILTAPEED